MPAFTFEKISPPIQHITPHIAPAEAHTPNKPRSVIVRIIDRFVASRVKSALREEKAVIPVSDRKRR